MKSINQYLDLLEIKDDILKLNESNLSSIISKLTPEPKLKSIVQKIDNAVDKRDPIKSLKNVKKVLSFMPKVDVKKIDTFMASKVSDYTGLKRMSKTILENSLSGVSDEVLEYSSSFLAISAYITPKNKQLKPRENLKEHIKEFVMKTRKFMDEQEEKVKSGGFQKEDLPDLAVAWVIIAMVTAFATGIGSGIYLLLAALAANVSTILTIIMIIVIAGSIVLALEAWAKAQGV